MDIKQIEKEFSQLFSQLLSKNGDNSLIKKNLKPLASITDRYVGEHYHPYQIYDISRTENIQYLDSDSLTQEIKIVILKNCDLQTIPDWVFNSTHIEGLLLDINPNLQIDTKRLGKLSNLKVLSLMYTSTCNFEFLLELNLLESLDISRNSFKYYPLEICGLKKLIYLDISTYNKFTSIPECIQHNVKLRVLRAHYNNITFLPDVFDKLQYLEQLILGNNDICNIPSSIYKLYNLKELDLFNNKINSVDFKALSEIEGLEEIYLAKNPIDNFSKELLDQKKGVISSLALKKYFSTGVYFEISRERSNDSLQIERLLRSARAIIFRGLYYGLRKEWGRAYHLVHSGYVLSRELGNNKLTILAGVFLGYLEIAKENKLSIEAYLKGERWSWEINRFWKPYEDSDYRKIYNSCLVKYAALSQLGIGLHYNEEQDFSLLLENVFDNNFDSIKISDDDKWSHSMLKTLNNKYTSSALDNMIRSAYDANNDLNNRVVLNACNANNELNNRDLLRGFLEIGLFWEAWQEVARQHCNDSAVFEIDNCPPKRNQELNLFIFQLTNRDKIRILAIDSSLKKKVIKIDSTSVSLNAITGSLFCSDAAGFDSLFSQILTNGKPIEFFIWDAMFGAYIVEIVDDEQNSEDWINRPITFHDYCQKNKITRLNIFPYGSLLGVPFCIGLNKNESKYALDYYNIINHPPFIPKKSKCESKTLYNVTLAMHDELKFASAEAAIISDRYENANIFSSTSKKELIDSFQKSEVIHFACHSKYGMIRLKISGVEIKIGAEDIKHLNLSRCGLVVMNACRTSEDPFVSLINNSSLPLAFLESGVRVVVSTTKDISDDDAFRFSIMLHEKISTSNKPVSLIFREVLLDCKEDSLPFFEDRLEEYNFYDLSSHMKYLKKYGSQEKSDSWKYYTIWENNYV